MKLSLGCDGLYSNSGAYEDESLEPKNNEEMQSIHITNSLFPKL